MEQLEGDHGVSKLGPNSVVNRFTGQNFQHYLKSVGQSE